MSQPVIPANFRGIPTHMKKMLLMASRLGAPFFALRRLQEKCRSFTAVNGFGKGAPQVSLSFLSHPSQEKSDGFILTARTEKELEVWISDGGFASGESLGQILDLRRKLMEKGGLQAEIDNPRYKLSVTYLVSHFHIDHINEGIFNILPCPFLHVKRVYYPHISVYAKDTNHDENANGDKGLRTRFMLSQKAYQPLAEMVDMPFGACRVVPFGAGHITLMMPDCDWGTKENLLKLSDFYEYAAMTEEKRRHAMPVQVVNSNCLCARIEYAARSMILTGDAMKRTTREDEPFDLLAQQYAAFMRGDIIKYPHHGQGRNPAWKIIKERMLIPGPEAMVVLTGHKGCEQAGKVLTENDLPWMDINEHTLTFTITEDGKILRRQGEITLD